MYGLPPLPMYGELRILSLGAAAVIDTVLLLAVLERRNRRYVLAPVVVLILGGWLWHAGAFVYALLGGAHREWAAGPTWAAMAVMSAGLLLMPSAMLHGVWRIHRSGLDVLTPPRPRYLLAYLPVLALVPVVVHLGRQSGGVAFIDRVWPFVPAYGAWLTAVNVAAAVGFVRLRRQTGRPAVRRFYAGMAAALAGLIGLHAFAFLVALPAWPGHRDGWLLAVMLSPVAPAVVFAYYVLRHDFMEVMVERTAVYAAIVAAGMLLHELAVRPVTAQLSGRFGLNFAIPEGLLVLGLIAAYQPLRQRAAEALRYLMGARVAPMRDRARRLAVGLSERAADPPADILNWFVAALRDALGVREGGVWLFDAGGEVVARAGAGGDDFPTPADARRLWKRLRADGATSCGPRDAPGPAALDALRAAGAALAVVLRHRQVDGLLVVGRRAGNRDLGEEEASAAVLLAEQLAVTLNVGLLHADRLAAERRALQGEKLAALGLVASSIAHEVKNPLSSIKTIATVLAEDLGPDDPRAEDVRLIRGEIDRLSATVTRLLRFARPAAHAPGRPASIADALAGTLHVMGHLARGRGVTIQSAVAEDLPPAAADEDALREVFINLVANAIEAAGRPGGGHVYVRARREGDRIMAEVEDDGPGLPDAVRRRLFEPFVTTRENGTGLGLYVVGRRVREAGGTVACVSPVHPSGGTRFTVEFPRAADPPSSAAAPMTHL